MLLVSKKYSEMCYCTLPSPGTFLHFKNICFSHWDKDQQLLNQEKKALIKQIIPQHKIQMEEKTSVCSHYF